MQVWNKSTICSLLRHGSGGGGGRDAVEVRDLRRIVAARAARASARSSWSSLEQKKNEVVGDMRRDAKESLCLAVDGLEFTISAIDMDTLKFHNIFPLLSR